jgi:hypothetical protein
MKRAIFTMGLAVVFLAANEAYEAVKHRRERQEQNVVVCKSQLVQIYSELKAYADQHGGRFPPKLSDLILEGYETMPGLFECPNSNDLFVNAAPAAAEAAEMDRPGHDSYRYFGNGLMESSPADSILIAEPPENHAPLDGHVVLLSGEVHSESPEELRSILGKLESPTTQR